MRILFAIPRLTYSGAPKMMAWVANQMVARGHEVYLITFFSEERARVLDERVRMQSLNINQSKSRMVRNSIGMIKTIFRLHKKIKQIRPDVVVNFLDSVGYVYLLVGRIFTKCRMVASERVDPYSYRGRIAKIRFGLMKYAHGIVFQTQGAKDFFEGNKEIYEKGRVIPNPVVLNDKIKKMQQNIPKYEEREKRIVTVGRLSLIQKRQDIAIDAFKIINVRYPSYKMVIYGDGQDQNRIQEYISAIGLDKSVILAGRTEQVEEEIFNARAFVLTSDFEGIPNSLIEAMCIGVPCVSTDCSPGGAALLIKNNENGYLVPKGEVNAVAEGLLSIIENEDISERFSKNAPLIATAFSENSIADKWEKFFLDTWMYGGNKNSYE